MANNTYTLQDLNIDKSLGYTIQDFSPDRDQVAPVANMPSVQNFAAHTAALSTDPQNIIDTYQNVLKESQLYGNSQTATKVMGQVQQQAKQDNVSSLGDIMTDPNISDSSKIGSVNAVYDNNNQIYSQANMLGTKALVAPVPNTTAEGDNTRLDMSKVLMDMNQQKFDTQKLYNGEIAKTDPTMQARVMDFGQNLVPKMKDYMLAKIGSDVTGKPIESFVRAFLGPRGNYVQYLRDYIQKLPAEQQVAAAQSMADAINDHTGVTDLSPNDTDKREFLQDIISYGGYSNSDRIGDNIAGYADTVFGLGTASKFVNRLGNAYKAAKAVGSEGSFYDDLKAGFDANYNGKPTPGGASASNVYEGDFRAVNELKLTPPEVDMSNVSRDMVASRVQPVTVSQNLKDTNPDKARNSFATLYVDQTGQAGPALYGTDKTDAIVHDLNIQIGHVDGSVDNKVNAPDGYIRSMEAPPADLVDFIDHNGLTEFDQAEKARTRAWKVNDFQNTTAINPRGEMFQIYPNSLDVNDTDQGFRIRGIYGPPNNGYSSVQDAMDIAQFGLRNTGIPDSSITILKRDGGSYKPIDPAQEAIAQQPNTFENSSVNVKGQNINLRGKVDGNNRTIEAFDQAGKKVGRVSYVQGGDGFDNPDLKVAKANQRQGIASALYTHAEKHGMQFPEADTQGEMRTRAGQAFRNARAANPTPVTYNEPSGGDYVVGIDHHYKISPKDVDDAGAWVDMDVKNNFFDRASLTSGAQGTFASHILPISSMLHPTIVNSYSIAADKANGLDAKFLGMVKDFAHPWSKSSPARQQMMLDMLHNANDSGVAINMNQMIANGLTDTEMDAIEAFKRYQDVQFHYDNSFFKKVATNNGWKEFYEPTTNTKVPVERPLKRGAVGHSIDVYDHITDSVSTMKAADLDSLYARGGQIAKLVYPVPSRVGGPAGIYVKSDESMSGTYTKAFDKNSQVLSYRPGYFQVHYEDPHHIIERVKDNTGKVLYDHSIETAGTRAEADLSVRRWQKNNPDNDYFHRQDRYQNTNQNQLDELGSQVASGRTTWLHRGERLQDATAATTSLTKARIRSPMETMVNNARSMARKIAYTDVANTAKMRAISQFPDYFPMGTAGKRVIPVDNKDIVYQPDSGISQNGSRRADAVTTAQYIKQMERGVVNLLDDGTKALLRMSADLVGEYGFGIGEKALRKLSTGSLTNLAKSGSYNMLMVLAPLRQALVQGNQAALLVALNPKWFGTVGMPQTMYLSMRQLGLEADHIVSKVLASGTGMSLNEADDMWQQFNRTGLAAGIDKQNMVRGAVTTVASRMVASNYSILNAPFKIVQTVLDVARHVGFDMGEFWQMAAAWAAHRDLAIKGGASMASDAVADRVLADARSYTGSMNISGDMPQNQNLLGAFMQYTQFQQKMWTAVMPLVGNRNIPFTRKAAMGVTNIILYGLPIGMVFGTYLANVVEDRDTKKNLVEGLQGWAINKAMELATGKNPDIDWSGMGTIGMPGTLDFIHNLLTGEAGAAICNTPSGSLVCGNDPKLTTLVRDVAKYTHFTEDNYNPMTFGQLMHDTARLSSGYTSAYKALWLLKTGEKISSMGGIKETDVPKVAALGTLLGMPQQEEQLNSWTLQKLINNKKELTKNFNNWYSLTKQAVADPDIDPNSLKHLVQIQQEFFKVYGNNNPEVYRMLDQRLKADINNGDGSIYQAIVKSCGLNTKGDCMRLIDAATFKSEDQRQELKQLLSYGDSFQPE